MTTWQLIATHAILQRYTVRDPIQLPDVPKPDVHSMNGWMLAYAKFGSLMLGDRLQTSYYSYVERGRMMRLEALRQRLPIGSVVLDDNYWPEDSVREYAAQLLAPLAADGLGGLDALATEVIRPKRLRSRTSRCINLPSFRSPHLPARPQWLRTQRAPAHTNWPNRPLTQTAWGSGPLKKIKRLSRC